MNFKYMRIQGRELSYVTRYPKGVFGLCRNLLRDNLPDDEEKQLFLSLTTGSKNIFRNRSPVSAMKR